MGLLYVFPISLEEEDFVVKGPESLTLKTYGLPYLFWGYAFAVLAVILFMFLAVKAPILKLVELGDDTDALLGHSLLGFILGLPVVLFSFFFYEKRIVKAGPRISMEHRLFRVKVFSETFELDGQKPFEIAPYLSSPNVARMKGSEESVGFQNKGYFILWITTSSGKRYALDRHSRKVDLQKLQELLEKA
jgi:hypothetical protein